MTIRELIADIESGSVPADLSLASTTRSAVRRLLENPVIKQARRHLAERPEDAIVLLNRAARLLRKQVPGYAHPDDLALAAYSLLLAPIAGPGIQRFVNEMASCQRADLYVAPRVARLMARRVPSVTLRLAPRQAPRSNFDLQKPSGDLIAA